MVYVCDRCGKVVVDITGYRELWGTRELVCEECTEVDEPGQHYSVETVEELRP